MMTGRFDLRKELTAYRIAAEKGSQIATRLYIQWSQVFGARGVPPEEFAALVAETNESGGLGSRVAGIKIFADGAIGSATAAIYGTYHTAGSLPMAGNQQRPPSMKARGGHNVETSAYRQVSGQLIYRPERLTQMVETAHEAGWQVAVHAIGDYAADLVMDAFEATDEPNRHRIEHAMILSDAQIERMASLGCSLTFQPEFLLRFGHTYHRQLGDERASMLKRTRSVLDAGIPLSFNSDRPIVGGDPWDGIRMAETREGFDPSERCTRQEAISAYTVAGSRVNGDGETYGTLDPGSIAEFQLYDENPLEG
jgi:predicted amidohydrolase YtcJ